MFRLLFKFFMTLVVISSISANGKTFYGEPKALTGHGDSLACHVPTAFKECDVVDFTAVEASVALPRKSGKWWLCWPGAMVEMQLDESGRDYITDRQEAVVTINGVSHRIAGPVDCYGGVNTLCVEWRGGVAEVFAGSRRAGHVASVELPMPAEGFCVGSNTAATVESAAMEIDGRQIPYSTVDPEEAVGASRQLRPVEGLWKYLDRETDPGLAVNGGNYRLAIAANSDGGFDIIYMEGASTNAAEWKRGMLKGRLTDLGFDDHYRLEWFDAMHRTMGGECYARMESADVITFNFPLYGASLRFQRLHSTM